MAALLFRLFEWLAKGGVAAFFIKAGLTLTVYAGLDILLMQQLQLIPQYIGSMPGAALQLALLCGVDSFVSIVCSALLTRAAIIMATQSLGITKAA